MERTTNLEKIRNGEQFTWGNVNKIHSIGNISIVEFGEWKTNGCEVLTGNESDNVRFSIYLDDKSRGISYRSLDGAIAGALAIKYDGINSQAGPLICRMLGIEEL